MAESRKQDGQADVVAAALAFAERVHGDQKRKHDKAPYVTHLQRVAGILAQHGYDTPEIQAAALLHDAVEDTPTLVGDILDAFGPHVAELVYWLTDAEEGKRKHRKLMSAWRLGRAPLAAKLIKLADLIDNSDDIARNDPGFAPRFLAEKHTILAQMADVEGDAITKLPIYREAVVAGQRR